MSKWSYGSIRATHCAVQIGYGNGLQSYVGLIDDVSIQVCSLKLGNLKFCEIFYEECRKIKHCIDLDL